MSFIPKPHEIYKHFKGNLYQIVTIAEHSETGEPLVIYQALYGEFKTYARPLGMFIGKVDRDKYPEVEQEYRFELQGADRERQIADSLTQSIDEASQVMRSVGEEVSSDSCRTVSDGEKVTTETMDLQTAELTDEFNLDPMVLEFLDADSYEQRLNILAGLHHRITDEMLTTMAIACDVEVADGDVEERYESLKSCLLTLEKYECNRLR